MHAAAQVSSLKDERIPVTPEKQSPAMKKKLDIDIKTQTESPILSITDSPVESVSPAKEIVDISPVHADLKVDNMNISVGRSPSDFFSEADEIEAENLERMRFKLQETVHRDSNDSLFDEESRVGHLKQFEKVVSKESHHEEKTTKTTTSVEEKLISKEEVEGEPPKIIMEEKVFSTEDTEKFSKDTESQAEVKLTTSEVITEEIEIQDDGTEIRKENKELTAVIDEDSNTKTEESTSKALTKREDVKETVYPFKKTSEDGDTKEQLLDTISSKVETLETTLHTVTDQDKHKSDETKLTSERLIGIKDDKEVVIEGSEKQSEEHTHVEQDDLKETGTASVDITKKETITEVLFDVAEYMPGEKVEVEPCKERHGMREEHVTDSQKFESQTSSKEVVSFDVDHDKKVDTPKETEKTSHATGRQQRDSGLYEESLSDDSDAVDPQQLENMAFDNIGFSEEDCVKPKEYSIKETYLDSDSEYLKQKDISPEDLMTKFDFTEELREEMKNISKAEEDGTLSLSGADLTEKRDHHMATPQGYDDLPVDESERFRESRKIDIDETDEALLGAVGPAIIPEMPENIQEADSCSSSSSGPENEIFDAVTGNVVPWEIQSQFTRQFSDSFVDQEGKDSIEKVDSNKSLDMGEFYRRDTEKDADVSFGEEELSKIHEELQKTPEEETTEVPETSPVSKKKSQRVRFSLSEDRTEEYYPNDSDDTGVHPYDVKINEEWERAGMEHVDTSFAKSEPHENITSAYQQAVIASIVESRIQSEQARQKQIEELESFEGEGSVVSPTTEVRITSADMVMYSSDISATILEDDKDEDVVEEEYEEESDNNVEMVTTMSQTVECQPISVVSRESRLAHEELLKESFDEKDRSVSPSIDSEELSTTYENQHELQEELDISVLSRKYPLAVHVGGKPLLDNEVYESSETDRDTTEDERLSPIEETSGDDVEVADVKGDKKVTFQTDTQNLCSVSSEDLVKTSTSSSEVEPTLLAASYDLDSGRVSHVVTSYDLSPDAVEKQFLPVTAAPKTILSSPEDDVFEADLTIGENNDTVVTVGESEQTPTEGDIELLPRDSPDKLQTQKSIESASAGSSHLPSPPAPSPFEGHQNNYHTTSNLEGAALIIKTLKPSDSVDSTEKIDLDIEFPTADDDIMSSFEIMSPSDLEGYETYMEKQLEFEKAMAQSASSQASGSSFTEVEIPVIPITPSAPPMPDLLSPDKSNNESSFEQSSPVSSEPSEKSFESPFDMNVPESSAHIPDILTSVVPSDTSPTDRDMQDEQLSLPNGPTEVEYNPEIDHDYDDASYQPPAEEVDEQQDQGSTDNFVIVSQGTMQTSQQQTSSFVAVSGSITTTQQTGMTESIIEELPGQSGQDILIVSDQTLYGLEMPSDEAASMTTSHVEGDLMNISAYTSTSVQDDTSCQVDSREAFSQAIGIDRTEEDVSERPSESFQDMPGTPVTEESHDTIEGETLIDTPSATSAPIETPPLPATAETRITPSPLGSQFGPLGAEGRGESYKPAEGRASVYPGKRALEINEETIVKYDTLKGYEASVQDIEDVDLERRTPETYLDDELDEELLKLKEASDYEIDTKSDSPDETQEAVRSTEERTDFDLKADSCDLDRPLTPTPVDKNQGFFDENFSGSVEKQTVDIIPQKLDDEKELDPADFELDDVSKDEIIEKTASQFVENVLEEVKVKVRYKVALEIDDDVAQVQSPLSENGGDMTDFADDLPFDEPDDDNEDEDFYNAHLKNKSIDRSEEFIEKDEIPNLKTSSKPTVLMKQFSEEIPEITLTQHLHDEIGDSDEERRYRQEDEKVRQEELVEEDVIKADFVISSEAAQRKPDLVDSGKVCVPEEADDDDDSDKHIEETFTPVNSAVAMASVISHDERDSGMMCVPEEADTEPEIEIAQCQILETKTTLDQTDSKKIDTEITMESRATAAMQVTSSASSVTISSTSVTTVEQSSTSCTFVQTSSETSTTFSTQNTSEENRFLGKSSDSNTFLESLNSKTSGCQQVTKHPGVEFKSESEQVLKSERSVDSSSIKKEKGDETFYDSHSEIKSTVKLEKIHSVTTSSSTSTAVFKSYRSDSADSLEEDRSSDAPKSAEYDDAGDSSSVDSFTTVVAADEEQDDDEDRMADFASLTSSIHSDIQGTQQEEEEKRDPLQELMAWAQDKRTKESFQAKKELEEQEIIKDEDKETGMFPWSNEKEFEKKDEVKGIFPHPWRKDEDEDNDSIGGSDRYDYVDRTALSVITELSEEDRFEIIEKEDIESESTGTGSDSRHYSSPDFPPPSPLSNIKFFSKSGEKDDISVSSSLLEFERLEREINHSRSSGSVEDGSKDSLGGSLDETKFLSKSLEKDDVSISSSLADFERLEREVTHGSSDSSVEKILSPAVVSPPEKAESGKSSVTGSITSLTEFERLEKDIMYEETRTTSSGSIESFSRQSVTSVTSSQASLNEFERLEQDFLIAEQLEKEAQKIVSILESGSLLPNQYNSEPELSHSESLTTTREILTKSHSKDEDIDHDSIEGKDEIEDDSLSENKKRARGDAVDDTDSLDGDQSMTASITSAILKSESASKLGTDFDVDSLHDSTHSSEGAMKISSDSLGEKLGGSKGSKDKFDSDSLSEEHDGGLMEKSGDSLGLMEKSGEFIGIMDTSLDSISVSEKGMDIMEKSSGSSGKMEKSVDSLGSSGKMEKSVDSLELNKDEQLEKFETDSLHEDTAAADAMQTSVDSLESYQIEPRHNVMEVSMDSAGTGWSSASSMFSRSSIDTMRSADHEELTDPNQIHDAMEASMESWEEYEGEEEETDNFYIISKYQSSMKEAAEMSKTSRTEKSALTHPYYDLEGNVPADNYQFMMYGPGWNENFQKIESEKSMYMSKQPYEEKKKIFTMTEWEAMKKSKRQQAIEEEKLKKKTEEEQTEKPNDENVETKQSETVSEMEKTLTSSSFEGETDSSHKSMTKISFSESSSIKTLEKSESIKVKTTETAVTSKKMKGTLQCCQVCMLVHFQFAT